MASISAVRAGCLTHFNSPTLYCPTDTATTCYELSLAEERADYVEYCTMASYSSRAQQLELEAHFGPTLLSNGWTKYW